jgi:hypothetical protein
MIPRSVKSGRKDEKGKDIYEDRASVSVTGYGELVIRKRAGHINYADNPVIVYEGDTFEAQIDNQGCKTVTYKLCVPRTSKKIIAAFMRIVRNDGSADYQWLLENDIDRLKTYSEKANGRWDAEARKRVPGKANDLYTSDNGQIDAGFLENKMIKHAFDTYPKIRIGEFTELETQKETAINYTIPSSPAVLQDTQKGPGPENSEQFTNQDEHAFGETQEQAQTVIVTDDSDTF